MKNSKVRKDQLQSMIMAQISIKNTNRIGSIERAVAKKRINELNKQLELIG